MSLTRSHLPSAIERVLRPPAGEAEVSDTNPEARNIRVLEANMSVQLYVMSKEEDVGSFVKDFPSFLLCLSIVVSVKCSLRNKIKIRLVGV